jgi:phosphatidylinositol glycan class W
MLHKYVWDSLTEYRSILCLYTFISILAVDFNAFPRRFAKAETYGVGLMDVGVGSFVISDALLSKQDQRSPNQYSTNSKAKGLGARLNVSAKSIEGLKASLQLAIVGILRILAVKAISYHEHVGEYGVHWNFFLTLGMVKLVSLAIPPKLCGLIGLAVGASHQFGLLAGLADYVNTEFRDFDSMLSMNKEGVVSLAGYVSLHCLARHFARASQMRVLTDRHYTSVTAKKEIAHEHFYFTVGFTCGCWFLACLLDRGVERVSRRSVNAAYIFWILANNLTWLCVIYTGRLLLDLYGNIFLCTTVNKFAFLAFLTANILVGAVNSTVNTLSIQSGFAILILTAYMIGVCVLSRVLYQLHSKGKLQRLFGGKKLKAHSPETEL